ncbi:class I SAM-dependent methyltransferase [Leucobacter allii]|uniref:class I SAM-dependent methyltransferase n=1 Tax=Leucobacter allii TaxID=2932247 RepID=UPI003D2E35A7
MRSEGRPAETPPRTVGRSESDALRERLRTLFAALSRAPDFDAPELQAFDAADELLLLTLAQEIADAGTPIGAGELVVIGDHHGALALGAASVLGLHGIRVYQDPLLGERALHANAARLGIDAPASHGALDAALLGGARLVLLRLPRGLDALAEIAEAIARCAAPDVRVLAGGRVKHMTLAQNQVLARSFALVRAGLARRKARVLTASAPVANGDGSKNGPASSGGAGPAPRWGSDPALSFRVAAFGATFGGPTLDRGSRLLLAGLDDAAPGARRIVDLGCGTGVLAVSAALARPEARVIATDQSSAAVAATRCTAEAAGVAERIEIHRADALEAVPEGWAELILLNPPFHTGATVHAGVAHRLIRSCARVLAPGGELRLVFNSPLAYRPLVEREIGPARQIDRDRTFTVLAARRR